MSGLGFIKGRVLIVAHDIWSLHLDLLCYSNNQSISFFVCFLCRALFPCLLFVSPPFV